MVEFDFWEVYDFYVLDKRQKETPDIPLNDPEIKRYHEFVRKYSQLSLEEFLDVAIDLIEGFEEIVEEEAYLSREEIVRLQLENDELKHIWDEDELPEYEI